jgi:hypothetical protein
MQSLAVDLGPSLESLADATFDLLKMQDWFDSILVIDDSTASDILSFRLRFVYQMYSKQTGTAALHDPHPGNDTHAHSITSTRNLLQVIKISKSLSDKEVRTNFDPMMYAWIQRQDHKQILFMHLQPHSHRFPLFLSSFHCCTSTPSLANLPIHLMASLADHITRSTRQIYFKLSNIQNSNRRVVLVHADESALIRIMETAHRLKLFDKSRFWFLLDGVIGHRLASGSFVRQVNLPTGVLALHQAPIVQEPATLYAIINLLEQLALSFRSDNSTTHESADDDQHETSCSQRNSSRSRQHMNHRLNR